MNYGRRLRGEARDHHLLHDRMSDSPQHSLDIGNVIRVLVLRLLVRQRIPQDWAALNFLGPSLFDLQRGGVFGVEIPGSLR